MKTKPPELPEGVEAFARQAAELAESNGIKKFSMKLEPDWGEDYESRIHVRGDITIAYWSEDGRGRPSGSIRISLTAELDNVVEFSPESSN